MFYVVLYALFSVNLRLSFMIEEITEANINKFYQWLMIEVIN